MSSAFLVFFVITYLQPHPPRLPKAPPFLHTQQMSNNATGKQ